MMKAILFILITFQFSMASAITCTKLLKKRGTSHIGDILYDSNSGHKATFNPKRELITIDSSGSKTLLLDIISGYTASSKSTTTSRLEERSVVLAEHSKRVLENKNIDFVPRDKKESGYDFKTLTAYGEKFLLKTDSELDNTAAIRMRKYYKHKIGREKAEDMKDVFESITALELKFKNLHDVTSKSFESFENAGVKPRFFIKDSTFDQLKKFTPEDFAKKEKVDALAAEISSLKKPDGKLFNNPQEVASFLQAIKFLRNHSDSLFKIKTVISYNRDSYSGKPKANQNLEYQYTVDRNIRIYDPLAEIGTNNLSLYLNKNPLTTVDAKYSFAELKAPVSEKIAQTPLYLELINTVESAHVPAYKIGNGKHSLGTQARKRLYQESLSDQIYTEGMLYYLIKGTGHLPTPPNRKKLVEESVLNIAIPVNVNGKPYKVIFGYRPNNLNGERSQIIASIRMTDHLGRKVSLGETNTKDIINRAVDNGGIVALPVNGQNVTFPSVIAPKVVKEYTDFFSKFYENHSKSQANTREIESLYTINSKTQLERYTKRMILQNKWNFFKDRVVKAGTQQLITGVAIVGFTVAVASGKFSDKAVSTNEKTSVSQSFIDQRKDSIIEIQDGSNKLYVKARKEAPFRHHQVTPILREKVEADITVDGSQVRLEKSSDSSLLNPIFNIKLID